jgi:hypothetical protein
MMKNDVYSFFISHLILKLSHFLYFELRRNEIQINGLCRNHATILSRTNAHFICYNQIFYFTFNLISHFSIIVSELN